MKKINPKCLSFKELSYSATGYILPCCWVDTPVALIEPQIERITQKHLKVSNNEKIEDIINSKEWQNFFEELKTDPAILCQKFCGIPLYQSLNKARGKESGGGGEELPSAECVPRRCTPEISRRRSAASIRPR